MNARVDYQATTDETDLAQRIRDELAAAQSADVLAREHRRAAGALLARVKADVQDLRSWAQWVHRAQLDRRTADLLIEMHAGGVPR